jgi:hypothetical protein
MAPHTGRYTNDTDRGRTPAQWYCLLAGAALLLAGIFGFLADAGFGVGEVPSGTVDGGSFLGFEVNGWHNLVHLASGLVLLAAANTRPSAKAIALGFGLVYGLVAIIGLIDGSDVIGLIPVNGADNILHVALAALGIVAGLISKARRRPGHSGDAVRSSRTETPRDEVNGRTVAGDDSVPGSSSPRVGH